MPVAFCLLKIVDLIRSSGKNFKNNIKQGEIEIDFSMVFSNSKKLKNEQTSSQKSKKNGISIFNIM